MIPEHIFTQYIFIAFLINRSSKLVYYELKHLACWNYCIAVAFHKFPCLIIHSVLQKYFNKPLCRIDIKTIFNKVTVLIIKGFTFIIFFIIFNKPRINKLSVFVCNSFNHRRFLIYRWCIRIIYMLLSAIICSE